jgi:hypothetical protein
MIMTLSALDQSEDWEYYKVTIYKKQIEINYKTQLIKIKNISNKKDDQNKILVDPSNLWLRSINLINPSNSWSRSWDWDNLIKSKSK